MHTSLASSPHIVTRWKFGISWFSEMPSVKFTALEEIPNPVLRGACETPSADSRLTSLNLQHKTNHSTKYTLYNGRQSPDAYKQTENI